MKKRIASMSLLCLMATAALTAGASAAETPAVCYPTSITCSEDQTELKKIYELSPEDNPAGIPRSDFEQDGYHYTLQDLLKQEIPENESRKQTETVSLQSDKKDLESVLTLLPQEKEFTTDDGFTGTLALRLDTVQVEPSGYGTSTKAIIATRSYPNLDSQDTQYIPKSIEDNGHTLTLQDIQWQTDNAAELDGYEMGNRFTAVATYTGSTTSNYIRGYTVTADYTGTVSHIALSRVRYVAVFSGEVVKSLVSELNQPAFQFQWKHLIVPGAILVVAGVGLGVGVLYKRKKEQTA